MATDDANKNLAEYKKALQEEYEQAKPDSDARAHMREHLLDCAKTITSIALTSPSDSLRLKAATYVLDRIEFAEGDQSDLEKFLDAMKAKPADAS
jgi:hypothetical protein